MSWNNSFHVIMNFVLQSSTEFVGILLVNSAGILQNSAKYPGPSVRDWQDVAEQPDILRGTQWHRDTWTIWIKYSLSVIFLGYQSQIYLQLLHETLCWSLNHTIEPVSPSLHQSHLFNLKKPLYHSFRRIGRNCLLLTPIAIVQIWRIVRVLYRRGRRPLHYGGEGQGPRQGQHILSLKISVLALAQNFLELKFIVQFVRNQFSIYTIRLIWSKTEVLMCRLHARFTILHCK